MNITWKLSDMQTFYKFHHNFFIILSEATHEYQSIKDLRKLYNFLNKYSYNFERSDPK